MSSIRTIITVAFISILVTVTLYLLSGKRDQHKNGFKRQYIEDSYLVPRQFFDVGSKYKYIAGITEYTIYLGQYFKPSALIVLNKSFKGIDSIELNIPDKGRVAWGAMKITIDSPYVLAYEGITPNLFRGSLRNNSLVKLKLPNTNFQYCSPISSSSFICRSLDTKLKQNVLKKISLTDSLAQFFKLDKQQEGVFSTDGMLLYNASLKQVIYVYYYRNRFNYLDTMLNKQHTGHTIDTITTARLKTGKISTGNQIKLLGNPIVVNRHAAADGDKLFIHSGLKADNESRSDFNNQVVIDVYHLKKYEYLYSFYLSTFKNLKLYEFRVRGNELIVVFENYVVVYQLPSFLFS